MNRRHVLDRAQEVVAAWNRGDAPGVVANMADDVIWRDVALGLPLQGRNALELAVQSYMTAFPDLRVTVNSSTIDGQRLAQEWTSTGTHQGELMGVAPTGRWIENYGAMVVTWDDDGKVIEGSVYWNPLAMLRQLGLLDEDDPAQAGPTVATRISTSSADVATTARAARAAQSGGARTRKSSPAAT
jgi:steroid delta-isomerase-like uncharacterized protein